MLIHYLGHAAFYLESGDYRALIDPFITGNPACQVSLDRFDSLTHIFVTHAHGDHLGDTVAIAKETGATIVTNFELANYLVMQQEGLSVHPMHLGGRTTLDGVTIKMTPALHGSGIITNEGHIYCGGSPCGFLIEHQGKKIYHAGDTGLTKDMELLEIEDIDLAMLPIGGNFTMDITDAVRATQFIKPKAVVPMHYNTFPPIQADPHVFAEASPCPVHVMAIDETLTLS